MIDIYISSLPISWMYKVLVYRLMNDSLESSSSDRLQKCVTLWEINFTYSHFQTTSYTYLTREN